MPLLVVLVQQSSNLSNMTASPYTLKQRPGALIEASRDMKRNKRAVMKAIGMPMKKKAKKPIKMSGTFASKSNSLGQGGRAAQLKARGVPGGVIGNLARASQAAPGQKNFHKKVKKSSTSLVKAPNSRYVRKAAKKGSVSLVKSPKSHRTLRTKKAKKNFSSDGSFGDEKIQGAKMERRGEGAKHFKRSSKRSSGKRYLMAPLAAGTPPSAPTPSASTPRPPVQQTSKPSGFGYRNTPQGAYAKGMNAMRNAGAYKSSKRKKVVKKKLA